MRPKQRHRGIFALWMLFSFFIILVLGGCTTIKIVDENHASRIERKFGLVSIHLAPEADSVVTEIKCLGIINSPAGLAVGFSNQEIAVFSDSCKLVLWVENEAQIHELKSLIGDLDTICPVIIPGKEE